MKVRVSHQLCGSFRQAGDVAHFFEEAILTIGNQFGHAAHAGRDRHDAASHRFQRGETE